MIKAEEINRIATEEFGIKGELNIRKMDSYVLAELLMSLEREFSVVFEAGEWEELESAEDIADLINRKLKQS